VLSAVGLLGAPRQEDRVRSWPDPLSRDGLAAALSALGEEAAAPLGPGAAVETAVDCRYRGQSHEVTVAAVEAFEAEHERRNGFRLAGVPIEVIALRASATLPSPVAVERLPVPDRRGPITGPAVVPEEDCTVWVPPGWRASVHPSGSWLLTRAH
jgi:N-methylhydantoinase A/oxoprolinase/acetone carboxylase beta subunit